MSEKNTVPPQYPLNPGPSRRKPISCCKLLAWTIATLLFLIVGLLITTSITNVKQAWESPHRGYYQNSSIEEVKNRGIVVQPLVNSKQAFDIGISVWVRAPKASHDSNETLEMPLFSDIVFRGLHTTDPLKFANIKFKMPNAGFREENLTNFDLRASFVLIPSSPSPLDHMKNFSTWKPTSVNISPVRTQPFPLLSSDVAERTMIDDAIDSYGVSAPLIQFHAIRSKCPHTTDTTDEDDEDEEEEEDDINDSELSSTTQHANDRLAVHKPNILKTTTGKSALKAHPYLVTRTHLRLVNEERLYNRKKYNKAHNALKQSSCGQQKDKEQKDKVDQLDEFMCSRNFKKNGNFETRLEIDPSDAMAISTDESEPNRGTGIEWFYAPYLSVYDFGAGPQDLKPIEVNRENCEGSSISTDSDAEYTEVEWKVSFRSIGPAQLQIADLVVPGLPKNMSQSEYKLVQAQSSVALINGLHGHRFSDDAHPRRVITLSFLAKGLQYAIHVLELVYWYTRTTTHSLSILGIALVGGSQILSSFINFGLGLTKAKDIKWWSAIWGLLIGFVLDPKPFLQLRTILRLEFGSSSKMRWMPRVWRLPATHKERASKRSEAQISWLLRGGICILVPCVYLVLKSQNIMLIAPLHPPPSPEDLGNEARWTLLLLNSTGVAGFILQRLFNQHTRLLSGSYKVTAYISLVIRIIDSICYLPAVAGRIDGRSGLPLYDGIMLVLAFWMAGQAWAFKSMSQEVEDLDSE